MSHEYYPYPEEFDPMAPGTEIARQQAGTKEPLFYLPDFTQEELDADPTLPERGEAAIADDTREYQEWRGHFLEQGIHTGPIPDTATFVENISKSPFGSEFMLIHHLRRRGYDILLTDTAVDSTGEPSPQELAFCTNEPDTQAVQAIGQAIMQYADREGAGSPGALSLLDAIDPSPAGNTMDYYYLKDAPDLDGSQARENLASDLTASGVQDVELMIAKGFMTSQVLGAVEQPAGPDNHAGTGSPEADAFRRETLQRNRQLYQILKDQGVRPFNIDQLYGMASGVIEAIFRDNPDIDPPANPPQRRRLF